MYHRQSRILEVLGSRLAGLSVEPFRRTGSGAILTGTSGRALCFFRAWAIMTARQTVARRDGTKRIDMLVSGKHSLKMKQKITHHIYAYHFPLRNLRTLRTRDTLNAQGRAGSKWSSTSPCNGPIYILSTSCSCYKNQQQPVNSNETYIQLFHKLHVARHIMKKSIICTEHNSATKFYVVVELNEFSKFRPISGG